MGRVGSTCSGSARWGGRPEAATDVAGDSHFDLDGGFGKPVSLMRYQQVCPRFRPPSSLTASGEDMGDTPHRVAEMRQVPAVVDLLKMACRLGKNETTPTRMVWPSPRSKNRIFNVVIAGETSPARSQDALAAFGAANASGAVSALRSPSGHFRCRGLLHCTASPVTSRLVHAAHGVIVKATIKVGSCDVTTRPIKIDSDPKVEGFPTPD